MDTITLFQVRLGGAQFPVRSDRMRLCAFLSGADIPRESNLDPRVLYEALTKKGLSLEPGAVHLIEDFLAQCQTAPVGRELIIAEGTPPVAAEDGRIEWLVERAPKRSSGDQRGKVDLRSVQTFVHVAEGQPVVRVVAATTGSPGVDVLGAPIPTKPGKPVSLNAGSNLRSEEDPSARTYFATCDGRLVVHANRILVEPTLMIRGDVDYSVGNIDFDGDVVVQGDLLDGFRVRGARAVKITGNVGAASVESDGDIEIGKGVVGSGAASIRAGGSLRATFLRAAQVVAGEGVVTREIIDSRVATAGPILASGGVIRGGDAIAGGGVEVGILGSPADVRTTMTVGMGPALKQELETLLEGIRVLEANATAIITRGGALLRDPEQARRLPADKQTMLETLRRELDRSIEKIIELNQKEHQLLRQVKHGGDLQIVVEKRIHSNVEVTIPPFVHHFSEDVQGPVRVFADVEADRIRCEPTTAPSSGEIGRAEWSEKRKHPRLPYRSPALFGTSGLDRSGFTRDLSRQGLLLEAPEPHGVGTRVQTCLWLPGRVIHGSGVVRTVRKIKSLAGMGRLGMGIELDDPGPDFLRLIEELEERFLDGETAPDPE